MALTFTTLKSAIQDYLENTEATFVADLPVIITQAEDRILHEVELPNFRKHSTGTATTGNRYLSTPTDFLRVRTLSYTNSSSERIILIQKDMSFIEEAFLSTTATAAPKYYSYWADDKLLLGPTPDSGYTMSLHYFHRPTSITTSGDGTSWLGTNFESALLYGCIVEAYIFMKGEQDLMAVYAGRYKEALDLLREYAARKTTSDVNRNEELRLRA